MQCAVCSVQCAVCSVQCSVHTAEILQKYCRNTAKYCRKNPLQEICYILLLGVNTIPYQTIPNHTKVVQSITTLKVNITPFGRKTGISIRNMSRPRLITNSFFCSCSYSCSCSCSYSCSCSSSCSWSCSCSCSCPCSCSSSTGNMGRRSEKGRYLHPCILAGMQSFGL